MVLVEQESKEQIKEDRKVQAENMRLIKEVKKLKKRIEDLEKFIGIGGK